MEKQEVRLKQATLLLRVPFLGLNPQKCQSSKRGSNQSDAESMLGNRIFHPVSAWQDRAMWSEQGHWS